ARVRAAGNVAAAPAAPARADEDRTPALREQRLEAGDAPAAVKLDAEVEDVVAFLVDDGFGQPEARDLRADHSAGLRILVEDHAVVAERRQVTSHGERSGAAAHQRDALAVLRRRRLGQTPSDVVLEI